MCSAEVLDVHRIDNQLTPGSGKARVYVGASPEAVLFAFDHFKANLPRVSAFVKPGGSITCIRLNCRADLRPQAQTLASRLHRSVQNSADHAGAIAVGRAGSVWAI